MEFDWTTFTFEIINFLILIWLLRRFVYKPLLKAIEKRRNEIHNSLKQAEQTKHAAEQLQQQFETRLQEREKEKQQARETLNAELEQERARQLQALADELEQARQKDEQQIQQQKQQWHNDAEDEALRLAATFAAKLLSELSGPELDLRLQQLFLQHLQALPETTIEQWCEESSSPTRIEVTSALPLDEERRTLIKQSMEQKLVQNECAWRFREDTQLIAGLRIAIGGRLLRANLQDELRFFSEAGHES